MPVAFWEIQADKEGSPVATSKKDKAICLYLDGSDGFCRNESKKNLNQALRSMLDGTQCSADDYALYVPALSTENRGAFSNRGELLNQTAHAREIANFLMPEIPKNYEQLALFFSKLTIVGYSHGCELACTLIGIFKKKLKDGGFEPSQIESALEHLGVVNIAKGSKYNLPDYVPAATYTVVSAEDKLAFEQKCARNSEEHESTAHWHWNRHAAISHALQDNHLVVSDGSGDGALRAIKLNNTGNATEAFASRVASRPISDWTLQDTSKFVSDAHHLYLYTNTDARFIPDKQTQTFQSMATAPMTVDIIQKFFRGSVQATLKKPRNAKDIIREAAENGLLPEAKELLNEKFAASKKHYNAVIAR